MKEVQEHEVLQWYETRPINRFLDRLHYFFSVNPKCGVSKEKGHQVQQETTFKAVHTFLFKVYELRAQCQSIEALMIEIGSESDKKVLKRKAYRLLRQINTLLAVSDRSKFISKLYCRKLERLRNSLRYALHVEPLEAALDGLNLRISEMRVLERRRNKMIEDLKAYRQQHKIDELMFTFHETMATYRNNKTLKTEYLNKKALRETQAWYDQQLAPHYNKLEDKARLIQHSPSNAKYLLRLESLKSVFEKLLAGELDDVEFYCEEIDYLWPLPDYFPKSSQHWLDYLKAALGEPEDFVKALSLFAPESHIAYPEARFSPHWLYAKVVDWIAELDAKGISGALKNELLLFISYERAQVLTCGELEEQISQFRKNLEQKKSELSVLKSRHAEQRLLEAKVKWLSNKSCFLKHRQLYISAELESLSVQLPRCQGRRYVYRGPSQDILNKLAQMQGLRQSLKRLSGVLSDSEVAKLKLREVLAQCAASEKKRECKQVKNLVEYSALFSQEPSVDDWNVELERVSNQVSQLSTNMDDTLPSGLTWDSSKSLYQNLIINMDERIGSPNINNVRHNSKRAVNKRLRDRDKFAQRMQKFLLSEATGLSRDQGYIKAYQPIVKRITVELSVREGKKAVPKEHLLHKLYVYALKQDCEQVCKSMRSQEAHEVEHFDVREALCEEKKVYQRYQLKFFDGRPKLCRQIEETKEFIELQKRVIAALILKYEDWTRKINDAQGARGVDSTQLNQFLEALSKRENAVKQSLEHNRKALTDLINQLSMYSSASGLVAQLRATFGFKDIECQWFCIVRLLTAFQEGEHFEYLTEKALKDSAFIEDNISNVGNCL